MKQIILFDIDGTLLNVQSGFMHRLIGEVFDELGLQAPDLHNTSFAGRTDRGIFNGLLGEQLHRPGVFEEVRKAYIQRLDRQLESQHVEVIESARETLDYCRKQQIMIGLLTGNFRESAYIKLNRAGLDHYFSFGAFGCDYAERRHLPRLAKVEIKTKFDRDIRPHEMIIIGDTPSDIQTAHRYGAHSVAVSTGHYDHKTLAEHQPSILLNSLEQPEQWLQYFDNSLETGS